jgi:hypothetical protein
MSKTLRARLLMVLAVLLLLTQQSAQIHALTHAFAAVAASAADPAPDTDDPCDLCLGFAPLVAGAAAALAVFAPGSAGLQVAPAAAGAERAAPYRAYLSRAPPR